MSIRLRYWTSAVALLVAGAVGAVAQHRPEVALLTPWLKARFAPPPWSQSGDLAQAGEVIREEGQTEAGVDYLIIDAVPPGESGENWTQRYTFVAESPLEGDFDDFVNLQVSTIGRGCTDAAMVFDRVLSDKERLFVIYCAAVRERPEEGEVAVFKMELAGRTLGKLSQRMRVPAFDLGTTRRNPPVSVDVLRAALVRVARMDLTPIGR